MEPNSQPAPIDFDTVAPEGHSAAVKCTSCEREIHDAYFEANGKVICGECRTAIEAHLAPAAGRSTRIGKAVVFGIAGAAAGSAIYYGVREITGYEIGLVAIVVGYLAGKGVFHGSGQRGGRRYQVLAIALTYIAMASTYIPAATAELGRDMSILALLVLVVSLPVLVGMSSIFTVVFLLIAIHQAWTMNKAVAIEITGPYHIGDAHTPAAAT